ncbi:copper chaperone PCu(A)C [uncultured Rhodoblastus sp.]|uniref:copper chaperone PCu(A)C n=1 Tax=uncultured Rhodoblastus sp. TaxID=543037 RepID=UPI0025CFA9CE|nr:copper chaperone PCu(A)C [uncultured Rhodoblastus sp.]
MIFSRKRLWGAAALAGWMFAGAALAADIKVSGPWSRATVRGASVGVGFLTVANTGKEPDTLLGGTTPSAEKVELHETRAEGGVMTMRALPEGIAIKPGATLVLKPGSYHLMLVGLKAVLLPGEIVHLTLNFAKAGPIAVDLPVESFGASGPTAEPPQISY